MYKDLSIKDINSMLKLPVTNDYLLSNILPDIDVINRDVLDHENAIIHRKIIIFGDSGSGKTTIANRLTEEAISKYGRDNVNAVSSSSLEDILAYGLDNRPIQVHLIDDYTLQTEDNDILSAYFKARNIWRRISGRQTGLILSIFCAHRFHSSVVEVRSTVSAILFRSSSVNPYDHSVIKKFLGNEGVADLKLIECFRDSLDSIRPYTPYVLKDGFRGIALLDKTTKNHLTSVKSIISKLSPVDRIIRRRVAFNDKE